MQWTPGSRPCWVLVICSLNWIKCFTVTVSLSTQRSKWVQKNCQENLTKCCGITSDGLLSRSVRWVGRLSLYSSQLTHPAGVYFSFHGAKRVEVLLLPPGWDGGQLKSCVSSISSGFSDNLLVLICTTWWREALWELPVSVLPKNTQWPAQVLNPDLLESSKLITRPLSLPSLPGGGAISSIMLNLNMTENYCSDMHFSLSLVRLPLREIALSL